MGRGKESPLGERYGFIAMGAWAQAVPHFMALRKGAGHLRQQDRQAEETNFRELVQPEVFACLLGFSKWERSDSEDLLPVPKVKTEIGKTLYLTRGNFSSCRLLLLPSCRANNWATERVYECVNVRESDCWKVIAIVLTALNLSVPSRHRCRCLLATVVSQF